VHHDAHAPAGAFQLAGDGNAAEPSADAEYAKAGDVAMVLQTSGTTSAPKVVPLSHRHILAAAHHVAWSLQLATDDRCLNVMPLFHVHGLVAAVLASLCAGSSVICGPGFSPRPFLAELSDSHPTWYTAVPTIHQSLLSHLVSVGDTTTRHSLRFVRSATSAMPPQVLSELEEVFRVPVVETYGMTEAASQITSNLLPTGTRKPGSAGLPVGLRLRIVGQSGERLPDGQTGEIVIRGPSVITGYEQTADVNANAFHEGWLRTGDLGYLDSDGFLYIAGRLKEMVNRGGEKIAPREIDEAMLEYPGVAQVAAFGVAHPTLGEDLAVAVVPKKHGSLTAKALRAHALARLAGFKVPSQIHIVDEIPKGPSGKVNRSALTQKFQVPARDRTPVLGNVIEKRIAQVFSEIVGTEFSDRNDNFLILGGDSLTAMRATIRLQQDLQVTLDFSDIFHHPSVAELATFIDGLLRTAGKSVR